MRKSWQVCHDRSLLLRSFWSFVLKVFYYCSAVWCTAADSHLKLLDRVVRSCQLCMLLKIKSNPMHPLSCALPLPYVPARVTRGALVAHRYSNAPPRCRTSQYRRTFVLLSVSLWNDLSDPVFHGVGLTGFKSRANTFLLAWFVLSSLSPIILSFYSFLGLVVWGWDLRTDIVFSLSPAVHCGLQLIIIIIIGILFKMVANTTCIN